MRKKALGLSLLSIMGINVMNSHMHSANAFAGKPLVQCSDDYSITDPFRVVNTVESDTTQPGYMLLRFRSYQGAYPFDGIVTTYWRNLSTGKEGHFQEQRHNDVYDIAAVPTGSGTVAVAIRFNNTLSGEYHRVLPTAQCNATLEVLPSITNDTTPLPVSHEINNTPGMSAALPPATQSVAPAHSAPVPNVRPVTS